MTTLATVTLKCPECGRFLCEVAEYGRGVCENCGAETVYTSKRLRKQLTGVTAPPKIVVST